MAERLGWPHEQVVEAIIHWWVMADKFFGDDPSMYFQKERFVNEDGKEEIWYYVNWYGFKIIQSKGFYFVKEDDGA